MKTFIAICKDVGGVYWRFKKNRRSEVYKTLRDSIVVDFYREYALRK